ncbi:5-dehydro-4-deoxy-D-glucuronate isomerase [Brevibacillus humidisoli]|uniref:5-dehydro-4-deoxy-D-glucuronate isomerase n=1 Tax=Brevibacillus humidisoli TaxID=2895522 RepID=UPI001E3C5F00|nr:5-dehydro-4-deoxy-D-glucuronate isomerase [Brevibacillus humidisoli]UFJ43109.1 5-dehydro-4-deoxy-D-glucuronate isomerase [Brevibacillus humidisoli]
MEVRQATHPHEMKHYTTERLRKEYLIESLFVAGELRQVYSHHDRMIIGGATPLREEISLDAGDTLRVDFYLERREIGIVNIGGKGSVLVENEPFPLELFSCLYIGRGKRDVVFRSDSAEQPAKFYFVSTPAHHSHPIQQIKLENAEAQQLGAAGSSNVRTIRKLIHADGLQSCQLMLGITQLAPNNMWNTMPTHCHDRRSEVYLYMQLPQDARVFHFMGRPEETRHLVVGNEQAVISPSWSIHSGVGTSHYSFIWAMAGENDSFDDMDFVAMEELR